MFRSTKRLWNFVFENSTIFHFLRNHENLVWVLFYQNTKNTLALRARWDFFPLRKRGFGFRVFSNYRMDLNCVQNYLRGAVFSRLARFCEKWGSRNSPKIGLRFMSSKISPKLLYQIAREWSRFIDTKPLLLAVFNWFLKSAEAKIY